MLFNSLEFLIFFPVVTLGYFVIPKKLKNFWLLVTSYYFYMCWQPAYALLILFSTITTFLCSVAIDKAKLKAAKKTCLTVSICINLAILFLFKYYGFFSENVVNLFGKIGIEVNMPVFDLLLPVGISFYTFQALGYAIDVYRGDVEREKSFITYALFVSFFPQLVAGPIERSKNLLPQFKQYSKFDYARVREGLVLMAWGFFKKMVIADGVASFVTLVYNTPSNYGGLQLVIATILFAFQVYCDFGGYSDIAIGCAKVLGFKLMRNFNKPYFSTTLQGYWRRWHVSLSSWFSDYVYIPLGGSRKGTVRTYINLLITFLVSGLWHGANWTFVFWGLINGIYVCVSRAMRPARTRFIEKHKLQNNILYNSFSALVVFLLICFGYIFFRANTFSDAMYITTHLFSDFGSWFGSGYLTAQLTGITFFTKNGVALVCSIVFMLAAELWEGKDELSAKICRQKAPIRWVFYYAIVLLVLFYGNFGKSPFVYFDF
ncbi:MAG: MBOAT family protein [Ruminococcaceae bacterium]|nr:MBOAT family protein [Oscillospiraceae bacterium]